MFFDNLSVQHISGPVTEKIHYYPFGLTIAGVSSKAVRRLENKLKFNDGNELQWKELNDGSGLHFYDAVFRMYDPHIGRFHRVDRWAEVTYDWSPYIFAPNNTVSCNDPLGFTSDTT